ncbi:hypothetical protein P261_01164 [Lachnospiraceae bacterium TWA4]|nr:hypothetical protein P261_01164 [Lachnospiraceae bacterium TWA4]
MGRFTDAKNLLIYAYDQGMLGGKLTVHGILEICSECGDLINGERFYKEFVEKWSESREKISADYFIAKLRNVPTMEQIELLEVCCQEDFREDWLYSLACLYDEIGDSESCVSICHKIIFYFGTGEYAKKAVELRQNYGELTKEERKQLKKQNIMMMYKKLKKSK